MTKTKKFSKRMLAWLGTLPDFVQVVAERFSDGDQFTCLRSIENDGHYKPYSFEEHTESRTVTMKITHGRDSYWPGFMVFGVDPETLVPCGCGEWKPPLKKQVVESHKRMAALKAASEILGGAKCEEGDCDVSTGHA